MGNLIKEENQSVEITYGNGYGDGDGNGDGNGY